MGIEKNGENKSGWYSEYWRGYTQSKEKRFLIQSWRERKTGWDIWKESIGSEFGWNDIWEGKATFLMEKCREREEVDNDQQN